MEEGRINDVVVPIDGGSGASGAIVRRCPRGGKHQGIVRRGAGAVRAGVVAGPRLRHGQGALADGEIIEQPEHVESDLVAVPDLELADERVAEEVERRRIEQEKERQAAVKISTEN